jgi:hypothetical protein
LFGLSYKGRVEGAHTFVVSDPAWRDYWCDDCVAFTWGRVIIYRSPRQFNNLAVRAHEAEHVGQSRRIGLLLYPLMYWLEHARKGYYNNKFEAEARSAATHRVRQSVERLRRAGLTVRCVPPRAKRRTKKNTGERRRFKGRRIRKVIHFG